MPSEGYEQMPAGKKKMCNPNYYKPKGDVSMESRNRNIITDLKIDKIQYKGNVVLRANS